MFEDPKNHDTLKIVAILSIVVITLANGLKKAVCRKGDASIDLDFSNDEDNGDSTED